MSENWYDLVHEANEDGESYLGPTVLYTSQGGLRSLAKALQGISDSGHLGRFPLDIADADADCSAPFSHVEVAEKPPDDATQTKRDSSSKAVYWFVGILLGLLLLAVYGLIRLAMDIIR